MELQRLVGTAGRCLDDLAPVPEWHGRSGTAWVYYFEHRARRLALRVALNPVVGAMAVSVHPYRSRPAPGADPFVPSQALSHPGSRSVHLHDVQYRDERDLQAKLETVFTNLARHGSAIDWHADGAGASYATRFDAGDDERARCRAAIPRLVAAGIAQLDPDLDGWLELPGPLALRLAKAGEYVWSGGIVPAYVRLVADTPGGRAPVDPRLLPTKPVTVNRAPSDSLVGDREMEALLAAYLDAVWQQVRVAGRGALLPADAPCGPLWIGDGMRLEPSKTFVCWLNRLRARTAPFADLIEPMADGVWASVYERTAGPADPVAVLVQSMGAQPGAFENYRRLSEHYVSIGDPARANLFLALGYLRAHRALGIATAKLAAAVALDPTLDGLEAARSELDAAKGEASSDRS